MPLDTINVLGVATHVMDVQDAIRAFEEIIRNGDRRVYTCALGVAGIMEARRNQLLQAILNRSYLNTPDGMPLVWLGRLWGHRGIRRVYGPDLLRDVCAYSADKGWTHFFYGSGPGVADKLKLVLEARQPGVRIVGTYCPPYRDLNEQEEADLIATVAQTRPDIFWVGISTPRQLYFMHRYIDRLDCKIMCAVGYAFDVNAGVKKDAPEWVKKSGLQWVHRGIKEPRLWKRYLPDNPTFLLNVLLQLLHLHKFPMFRHDVFLRPTTDANGLTRFPVLAANVTGLTMELAVDVIDRWIRNGERRYVHVCTCDTMVKCYDRPDLAEVVNRSGMATTDGMPLVWIGKAYGLRVTRIYGPDLVLRLCEHGQERGYRHYFYGADDRVLERMRANLVQWYPKLQVAGMHAPPFRPLTDEEEAADVARINAARPDIVWCGLGTPKQDYWMARLRPRLDAAVLIGVGAAFNFHAGTVRQAPRWMMNWGLEWIFRLMMEPRRLWRRYLLGNPRFIGLFFLSLLRLHSSRRTRRRLARYAVLPPASAKGDES